MNGAEAPRRNRCDCLTLIRHQHSPVPGVPGQQPTGGTARWARWARWARSRIKGCMILTSRGCVFFRQVKRDHLRPVHRWRTAQTEAEHVLAHEHGRGATWDRPLARGTQHGASTQAARASDTDAVTAVLNPSICHRGGSPADWRCPWRTSSHRATPGVGSQLDDRPIAVGGDGDGLEAKSRALIRSTALLSVGSRNHIVALSKPPRWRRTICWLSRLLRKR